jgi:hypothetical protein
MSTFPKLVNHYIGDVRKMFAGHLSSAGRSSTLYFNINVDTAERFSKEALKEFDVWHASTVHREQLPLTT